MVLVLTGIPFCAQRRGRPVSYNDTYVISVFTAVSLGPWVAGADKRCSTSPRRNGAVHELRRFPGAPRPLNLVATDCPQMRLGSMLIDRCCRLRAAVALRAVEIQGSDAMLAEGAFECGDAIYRFDRVISHVSMVVLLSSGPWVNRCATLGPESCYQRECKIRSSSSESILFRKVSVGSQSPDLFFVGYHCDVLRPLDLLGGSGLAY
jgi:hypothetical protein